MKYNEPPKDRPSILFVITKSNWGGAQRYVYDLATSFEKDFHVAVALGGTGLPDAPAGVLEHELRTAGIRTIFIQSFIRNFRLGTDIRMMHELYQVFRTHKPDIVHFNSSKAMAAGALAARIAGVPHIVSTVHGWAFREKRSFLIRCMLLIAQWIGALCSHTVVVINAGDLALGKRLSFLKRKTHLIYNGIAEAEPLRREQARAELIRRSGAPADTFWMGTVAELTKNKGFAHMLAACSLLKERGAAFSYLIIGDGEERISMQNEIRKRGLERHIFLLGFVPDAQQYLRALDCFVLPSIKEGHPYVLLEAGIAGIPVIATDIDGSRDIISSEEYGILVPPQDPDALGNAIMRLVEQPETRKALGTTLKKHVMHDFSREQMFAALREIYREKSSISSRGLSA